MRISEVATHAGIPASTVRFYERIGLLPDPPRTASGYRSYDEEAAARLAFVVRARSIGLTLGQIAEVLPIWGGVNCGATHERISALVETKRAEVLARVEELRRFAEQLDDIGLALEATAPPPTCRPDLSCCVPTGRPAAAATTVVLSDTRRPHTPTR